MEVDGDNYDYLNRHAEICIQLNLFEEASLTFKKSIILGDNRLIIHQALADVLHFIGDYNDACEVLICALEVFPNALELNYRLAGINFLLRKNKDALFFLEKGLKADVSYLNIMKGIFPEMFLKEEVITLVKKYNT